ncbi:MAG: single-stranded DNA-binding protein [Patescibacteria group bacterium]|uniref:Single-stranded DNA-binding protein n=1 Tax=candidate division WWE3 bacterium TaxID=2053526 RepID=A0A955EBL0_UNCKA|nr:single-stranded DNA-binding protein [candidate division WWE3 bacterium]
MSARSLNKVMLIGNLTRDPELRYTPQNTAVCSFGIATNREWTKEGEKVEVADFHNVVAWNKLAEICSQLLSKGTKIYIEGRLQTRDWLTEQGEKRYKTEVVIDEMIILSSKGGSDDVSFTNDDSALPSVDVSDIDLDEILGNSSSE